MATRIYKINQGDNMYQVTDGVGSATASKNIELTVDFGASPAPTKMDVLNALELFQEYITRGIWPPA